MNEFCLHFRLSHSWIERVIVKLFQKYHIVVLFFFVSINKLRRHETFLLAKKSVHNPKSSLYIGPCTAGRNQQWKPIFNHLWQKSLFFSENTPFRLPNRRSMSYTLLIWRNMWEELIVKLPILERKGICCGVTFPCLYYGHGVIIWLRQALPLSCSTQPIGPCMFYTLIWRVIHSCMRVHVLCHLLRPILEPRLRWTTRF